jgi:hypothetical protein
MRVAFYLLILAFFLFRCTESLLVPTEAQRSAVFLSGKVNETKTWIISRANVETTQGTFDLNFTPCYIDNKFTFSNNNDQSYELTEGNSKCVTTDPTIIEKGTWAFTKNGKKINIAAASIFSNAAFFAFLTEPADVTELTNDRFTIKIKTVDRNNLPITYVFYFIKA